MKTKSSLLKYALLAAAMFIMNPMHAWEPSLFGVRIPLALIEILPNPTFPRTPIEVPQVGQAGHTLYFPDETALFLNIYSVDEEGDETLEYSTSVDATTTEIQLPTTLSGTYIIEVIRDGLCFRGEIEL